MCLYDVIVYGFGTLGCLSESVQMELIVESLDFLIYMRFYVPDDDG